MATLQELWNQVAMVIGTIDDETAKWDIVADDPSHQRLRDVVEFRVEPQYKRVVIDLGAERKPTE